MDDPTNDRRDAECLCPGWKPAPKAKIKGGNGLAKRYFDAKPDGTHGESKKGWGPGTYPMGSPSTKKRKGVW